MYYSIYIWIIVEKQRVFRWSNEHWMSEKVKLWPYVRISFRTVLGVEHLRRTMKILNHLDNSDSNQTEVTLGENLYAEPTQKRYRISKPWHFQELAMNMSLLSIINIKAKKKNYKILSVFESDNNAILLEWCTRTTNRVRRNPNRNIFVYLFR